MKYLIEKCADNLLFGNIGNASHRHIKHNVDTKIVFCFVSLAPFHNAYLQVFVQVEDFTETPS